MAQVLKLLSTMWEIHMEFQSPGFDLATSLPDVDMLGVKQPFQVFSQCLPPSPTIILPFK